ncbi:MAG: cytochrome P450 [Acidobacteria bacterium]|nr:cytochrome P450 [Acidobacteriota bacterium]
MGNIFLIRKGLDPERWRPRSKAEARPQFSYFPFGGGPRLCIGESFAWMEGVLAFDGHPGPEMETANRPRPSGRSAASGPLRPIHVRK